MPFRASFYSMAAKSKINPSDYRVVVVDLKVPKGTLPVAGKTKRAVKALTERVKFLGEIKDVVVFPRFGQFSINASRAVIDAIAKQPEVAAVMENDAILGH